VIPVGGVIRVSRAEFDPERLAEVQQMLRDTSRYLRPAIERLDGLLSYHAGTSPSGSIVAVSLWDSDAHATQMDGRPSGDDDRRAQGCRGRRRERPDDHQSHRRLADLRA
jgi:hypothetical protein